MIGRKVRLVSEYGGVQSENADGSVLILPGGKVGVVRNDEVFFPLVSFALGQGFEVMVTVPLHWLEPAP